MPKALIISSDEGTRYLYEVAISYQKIDVHTASTILEGIKKIAKDNPDVVILDVMVIDFENILALKEAKDKTKSMPVIILTDMKNSSKKKEVSVLGAVKTMVKDESSLGELISSVREVVRL